MGHPLVVWPTIGFFLWSGYMLLVQPDTWIMAAAAFMIGAPVMRAYEQCEAYRIWRGTWNAMAGQTRKRRNVLRPLTGAVALAAIGLYLVATLDRTDTQNAIGVMLVWLIGVGVFFAGRSLWRKKRAAKQAKDDPVTVCVRTPLLPVPTLQQAYAALPAHCWVVLGGR
ncbi:MAG: hypothetical protein WBL20_02460 [Sphingobium sp.]|uniref:hypothetical protein n=1 Tax=Sphingobium sp. TaxID=1912891 RepID=UPI002E1E06EE